MWHRPVRVALLPLPLALLPFFLAAVAVLVPCRSLLVLGPWRGVGAPLLARLRIPRRSLTVVHASSTAERCLHWLKDLGMDEAQVTKATARCPALLRCSVEHNLEPTVQWFKGLGVDDLQVKKAIIWHPQLRSYSVENNLKPTVQWLKDLGLDDAQVAKVIAIKPQLFGFSLENSLKPNIEMLHEQRFAPDQIVRILWSFPPLLGLSAKRLAYRMKVLEVRDSLTEKALGTAMLLTDAQFAARFS
mmetsp:Transcript_79876/g.258305  ORF Transcript_79876/g.258305 Transcript_79876/m.258305 type:complete len:245 (+) Transcript_79876:27-761(+)